jgi:hypothetical protein
MTCRGGPPWPPLLTYGVTWPEKRGGHREGRPDMSACQVFSGMFHTAQKRISNKRSI